ncbi:hypothetical protein [Conexibacter sp. SYSU D00693]|uniref:hypothetical protein n=1 Tax=Conexibacter sp. SYSU D00693 TaxID=2812560 RepID=UPI00196AB3BC|nr:hypothetical protein [Conexibacter sp. SYSU D00693]
MDDEARDGVVDVVDDGDVELGAVRRAPPEGARRPGRQRGVAIAGQDRREAFAVAGEDPVAHGIDAGVHRAEQALPGEDVDRRPREAELEELLARDDAVLALREVATDPRQPSSGG